MQRHALNVPSAPVSAYKFYENVAETNSGGAMCLVSVCKFIILGLASFLTCQCDGLRSFWVLHITNRSWGAHGVHFPLRSRILRPAGDVAFIKLLDYSMLDLFHTLVFFKQLQAVDWSQSSCVR